ncbi:mCG113965, partial [Mus musculus]
DQNENNVAHDAFPRSCLASVTRTTACEPTLTWRVTLGSGAMDVTLGSIPGHVTCLGTERDDQKDETTELQPDQCTGMALLSLPCIYRASGYPKTQRKGVMVTKG